MGITHAQQPTAVPAAQSAAPSLESSVPERPVFAARSHRRPLWLARASRAIAALVGLWVLALIAGALGLGRLPGVPDLRPSQLTARPDTHASNPASARGSAAGAAAPASGASDLRRTAPDTPHLRTRSTIAGGRAAKAPASSRSAAATSPRRASTTTPGHPVAAASPGGPHPAPAATHGKGNGSGVPASGGTPPTTTTHGRSGTAHNGGNSVGKGKGKSTSTSSTGSTGNGATGTRHGYGRTKAPAATP